MNTMRVFLHDLPWQQDPAGYKQRIGQFLTIAAKHNIRPMFVLFDSCWDPAPKLGKQRAPKPGVHNSGWVQSPGAAALQDPKQSARLEAYVKGVVGAFANDERVLAWDIWNEPDNTNGSSYGKLEPANKVDLVLPLMKQSFAWARAVNPKQPLTAGVWQGDWSTAAKLSPMAKAQLDLSDVITFHNYDGPAEFEKRIQWLKPLKPGPSCAPSTWRVATAARSRGRCRWRRSTKWRRSTGVWWPASRRRSCPGIRGRSRMSIVSRRSGSTKCSRPMGRRIGRKRRSSSER
ncbi:MAG: cellulase family glycosylhydrolase [Paludibaculum sp.]